MSNPNVTLRHRSQAEVLHRSAGCSQVGPSSHSRNRITKTLFPCDTPLSQQLRLEESCRKGKLRTATTLTSENCLFEESPEGIQQHARNSGEGGGAANPFLKARMSFLEKEKARGGKRGAEEDENRLAADEEDGECTTFRLLKRTKKLHTHPFSLQL